MTAVTYEQDLAGWLSVQLGYLKAGQYEKIDLENFIEEVEGVVRTEKRCMKSHFKILIAHLLKWHYQPSHRSRSWLASITNARDEINSVLDDSPSLKNYRQLAFEEAWAQARKIALQETGLPNGVLPKNCPWDLKFVLSKEVAMSDEK